MMKISFNTLATPELSGEEAVLLARKHGYDGIDLRVSNEMGELTLQSSDSEISSLKNIMESEGIACSSLLCYNEYGKMEDSLIRYIELAEKIGAEAIRIFTGEPDDRAEREIFFKNTAQLLLSMIEKYNSKVKLLIQNHRFNASIDEIIDIMKTVSNPLAGILFSPEQCLLQNEDIFASLNKAKPYIRQIYLADVLIQGEKYICMPPGEGQIPIKEIVKNMMEDNFCGWMTFKWERIWQPKLESADVMLPRFMQYIK